MTWTRPGGTRLTGVFFLSGLDPVTSSSRVVGEKRKDVRIAHFEGVGELKAIFVIKPGNNFVTLEERLLERQQRVVGRVGPFSEVFDKPVLLWILVDIEHQAPEIRIRCHFDTTKGALKERPSPPISGIEGSSIRVEKIGELFTWSKRLESNINIRSLFWLFFCLPTNRHRPT